MGGRQTKWGQANCMGIHKDDISTVRGPGKYQHICLKEVVPNQLAVVATYAYMSMEAVIVRSMKLPLGQKLLGSPGSNFLAA